MARSDRTEVVETVGVRPYARLLTMLGEQLIKNDRIALVELIKNCYDADATHVRVDLIHFHRSFASSGQSRIAVIDDGSGMSEEIIRNHWLNPATPAKKDLKQRSGRSPRGRVIQGDKGIGRFAMFKLGSRVSIVTRPSESSHEFVVDFDLSFLDATVGDDQPSVTPKRGGVTNRPDISPGPPRHVFIDEIEVQLTRRAPLVFDGVNQMGLCSTHGTRLEVSGLRSNWTETSVRAAYSDVSRLQPLVPRRDDGSPLPSRSDFDIAFCRDGVDLNLRQAEDLELRRLFHERAVLAVTGHFSDSEKSFLLNVNEHTSLVQLTDQGISGLRIFKRYFSDPATPRSVDDLECGSFDFTFYVFDLSPKAPVEFHLDDDEKAKVKEHRIYLYRDGVRVLPYGDVEDDWLQLDVIRGTQGADRVLSNDQTVGFVYISQEQNPRLVDKTNREGLLETGRALGDFVALLQLVVAYLRRGEFATYLITQERKREALLRRQEAVAAGLEKLKNDKRLAKALIPDVELILRNYLQEREFWDVRLERTEDLAGVGLSVEAASHDIISTANQALRVARSASEYVKNWLPEHESLARDSRSIVESLAFVSSRLEDVQGLFVSTRKAKRMLDPADFVTKVARMYDSLMKESGVRLDLRRSSTPWKVFATDAALLQVFVNLFDNAIYWMSVGRTRSPIITVFMDVLNRRIVFADNGPGVRPEDEPFIFEPFFSGKGDAGKGLGLYIARQVSQRSGFEIDLLTDNSHKITTGANFVLTFQKGSDA